jgi:outer membrane lipoprotein-sorting protein
MFGELLMVSLLISGSAHPIQSAIEHYQNITSYQMQIRTTSNNDTSLFLYYFKKPGFVRVELQQPFKGAVLIYDPVKKQAKLWPFGRHSLPGLALSPGNRLIKSPSGQQIDQSDVGTLYQNTKSLQDHGKTDVLGLENIDGKETVHLVVEGDNGFSIASVHRYELWLNPETGFPARVVSYNAAGELMETVDMEALELNPDFPNDFFDQ